MASASSPTSTPAQGTDRSRPARRDSDLARLRAELVGLNAILPPTTEDDREARAA